MELRLFLAFDDSTSRDFDAAMHSLCLIRPISSTSAFDLEETTKYLRITVPSSLRIDADIFHPFAYDLRLYTVSPKPLPRGSRHLGAMDIRRGPCLYDTRLQATSVCIL